MGKLTTLVLIISGSFLLSCENHSEYIKTKGKSPRVILKKARVVGAEDIVWKVGKERQERLSQGLSISADLPILERNDIIDLVNEVDADSWLIQIVRTGKHGKEIMGFSYIPLPTGGSKRKAKRGGQMKRAVIHIMYAPAYISERLRKLHCPTLGHKKQIDRIEIYDDDADQVIVGSKTGRKVLGKIPMMEFIPNVYNGGMSLVGNYKVQVALFSKATNELRSNLVPLDGEVRVIQESEKYITDCAGFRAPEREEEVPAVDQFKFGR